MLKAFIILLLLISSIALNAQSLMLEDEITLNFPERFEPKMLDHLDDQLLIIGQQRNKDALATVLFTISSKGKIVKQRTIREGNAADRPIDTYHDDHNGLWLLVNSYDRKSDLHLYQIDENIKDKNKITISIEHLSSGISIGHISDEKIWLLASYQEHSIKSYPIVIVYDRKTKSHEYHALDYNNPSEFTDSLADYGVKDSDSEEKKAMTLAMIEQTKIQLFKNANDLINTENNLVVVGAENTNNMGDFWAASVSPEGQLLWEQLYERPGEPGVDALKTALSLPNNKLALIGQHYNKKDNLNYSYSTIVVDPEGNPITTQIYDTGYDEYLIDAIDIENNILLLGYLNQEPIKKWIGENVENSNLYFVLTDQQGNQLLDLQVETESYDRLVATRQVSQQEIMLLAKRSIDEENWKYYLQNIRIVGARP